MAKRKASKRVCWRPQKSRAECQPYRKAPENHERLCLGIERIRERAIRLCNDCNHQCDEKSPDHAAPLSRQRGSLI